VLSLLTGGISGRLDDAEDFACVGGGGCTGDGGCCGCSAAAVLTDEFFKGILPSTRARFAGLASTSLSDSFAVMAV
jgi:hypothetical protein